MLVFSAEGLVERLVAVAPLVDAGSLVAVVGPPVAGSLVAAVGPLAIVAPLEVIVPGTADEMVALVAVGFVGIDGEPVVFSIIRTKDTRRVEKRMHKKSENGAEATKISQQ